MMTKTDTLTNLVKERIEILFDEAEKAFKTHPERSNRYVELARILSMKINYKLPKEIKMRFCKFCYAYLVPGANCKIRLNSNKKVKTIQCEVCGKTRRIPYSQRNSPK